MFKIPERIIRNDANNKNNTEIRFIEVIIDIERTLHI